MAEERSITGELFRYMGLGSAGVPVDTLAPHAQNPAAAEKETATFLSNTQVGNPSIWMAYNSTMQRPGSYDEMLRLWDEMTSWDLLSTAVTELVDEVTQADYATGRAIWFECNERAVEQDLNKMLDDLEVEDFLASQVWYETAFGNAFEKLHYEVNKGVQGMSWVHPMDVRRYWLVKNRKCIGFKWAGNPPNKTDLYMQGNLTVPRVSIETGSSTSSQEDLWYPWDFCCHGDTKISLLDGRDLSMKQIQQEFGEGEFWVYSSTSTGRVVPGKAHSLRLTRKDTDIVEVTLDNGEKIKCTPDHRFMLRDGTYQEAQCLAAGDSLMPLYRKKSTKEEHGRAGYDMFWENAGKGTGRWRFTHWRVAEHTQGTRRDEEGHFVAGYHAHHRNFIKTDNRPDNLQWLTVAEHNKLHCDLNRDPVQKAHCHEARSEAMKRLWHTARELMLAAARANANTPERLAISSTNGIALRELRKVDPALDQKIRQGGRGRMLARLNNNPSARNTLTAAVQARKANDPEFALKMDEIAKKASLVSQEKYRSSPEFRENVRRAAQSNGLALQKRRREDPEFATAFNEKRNRTLALNRQLHNHKVVSVAPAGTSDVYDFEVDGEHNFALSAGVFVHNCHIRRLYKHRMSEHGEPIFNEVQGIYKKLRMALDQMLVYRAQMQPDRYSISIDTQDQPPIEQMRTIQRWKQQFRMKLAFGQGGAQGGFGSPTDFKAYYDAQALDTVLWISRPKGFQHEITKLPGTSVVPDVYDIELLTNLFFSAMRMPKSWLGIGDQTNGPASGKALLAQDMRFLRAAKSIRRPVVSAYTWLGYFHCLLKGVDIDKLNITAKMSDISSLEDQLRLELLANQIDLLAKIADVLEAFDIPRHAMVELMFRKYMHLPDDVVNAVITALPPEKRAPMESKKKGAPSTRTLLSIIESRLEKDPKAAQMARQIKDMVKNGPSSIPVLEGRALCRGHTLPTVQMLKESATAPRPGSTEKDLVVSSYGEIPGLVKAISTGMTPDERKSVQESDPGYRRWGPTGTG